MTLGRVVARAVLLACLLPGGCGEAERSRGPEGVGAGESGKASEGIFVDVSEEIGLDFVHFNGMSGDYYFPEIMGPGGALVDYDGDGDLDLYLVQGRMLGEGKTLEDALFPPRHPLPLQDRLYRNDLGIAADGSLEPRLVDVTESSGLSSAGYGMGVASGDFDNDGWVDLYVTNFGPNRLFRNNGDGTFRDATALTGTDDGRWSVAALFFDFDRDGWLDLYVGNYLDFTLGTHKECVDTAGARDWCGPAAYNGVTDRLFRNRGDGTFEDVSRRSGIGVPKGKGLGAVAADLDSDGWLDLYVANDGEANFLWLNREDGTFQEEALLAGCAVDADGRPQASMGVDAGDFDNDGDEDLVMTHLTNEANALFRNRGDGVFAEVVAEAGLKQPSWETTGFGVAWLDYDNDGWLDLLAVNGAVHTIQELAQAGDPYPLHQTRHLFRNLGNGRFAETTEAAGAVFELSEVGRGAAFGDVDNDGGTDVLVVNNNGPARLLLNTVGSARRWLGFNLVVDGRAALGSGLRIVSATGRELWRRSGSDGSYASANDARVQMGLSSEAGEIQAEIRWLDGEVELWRDLPADRYVVRRRLAVSSSR